MKRIFLLCLLCAFVTITYAQKKLTPVTKSGLTGIGLPAGSKQDARTLNVSAATTLLEMESSKTNTKLQNTEVLVLPPASLNKFNKDSLVQRLITHSWKVIATKEDYLWLQKDNRFVIAFFTIKTKETGLYFAEATSVPNLTSQESSTTNNQPAAHQTITQPTNQPVSQPQKNSNTNTNGSIPGTMAAEEIKTVQQNTPTVNGKFAFSSTNFDDGWTSKVQEDWVEVTKGNMKVLLHYPKEGTIFPADPGPLTNAAWNILVAPRYSNLKNYKTTYIATSDRPYLGMSYATENATGKNVFIVFFRQGQTGWLEFIAPDKNSFIQQYKFDPETIQWDSNTDLMIPLANMIGYNKFALAAFDLKGKWTSDFTGIQQLYNVYTGQYAGMNINQSNEEFIFNDGNSYTWKLLAVNGVIGNVKAIEVKSSGQFTIPNNWQVYFSKIESGPRTFHAFWSCIKGARLLNLLDANAPGSGIYTKYGLAK